MWVSGELLAEKKQNSVNWKGKGPDFLRLCGVTSSGKAEEVVFQPKITCALSGVSRSLSPVLLPESVSSS